MITRNGEGEMVVMSMVQYSQLQQKIKLTDMISAAQADYVKGD